jgi:copper resistance protein B
MNRSMRKSAVWLHRWIASVWLLLPAFAAAQDAGMNMSDMPPMQPAGSTSSSSSAMPDNASMQNMDMHDDASQAMLLFDQLEYASSNAGHGPMWEAEAWYGNDDNKLWLRSEGEGGQGRLEDGDLEALWSHPISAFWNTQLGLRRDLGIGPQRNWAAFGLEGLSPYWIELEATAYAAGSGRFAGRARAEYTLRFTQHLMLQPELEINLYNKDDRAQQLGDSVANAQLGLRLRYEITRQLAPYIGVVWTRRFGDTAFFAREDQAPIFDRQWVIGIRIWF